MKVSLRKKNNTSLYALNVGSKGSGKMGSWTHDTGIVLNIRHIDGLEQTSDLGVSDVSSVLKHEQTYHDR
jgi:hypothetical protein